MSVVRANWHVAELAADDTDPFGPRVEIQRVGRRVEVDDADRLTERLARTIDREEGLKAKGLSCAIKDDPQATCLACPLRHVDPLDGLTPLCAVGVEQDSLITRLRVLEHGAQPASAT